MDHKTIIYPTFYAMYMRGCDRKQYSCKIYPSVIVILPIQRKKQEASHNVPGHRKHYALDSLGIERRSVS